jgi:hypothetical protein
MHSEAALRAYGVQTADFQSSHYELTDFYQRTRRYVAEWCL